MKTRYLFLPLLCITLFAAACQGKPGVETQMPSASETPIPPTAAAIATETLQPSPTATATETEIPTITPTATETPTLTPTPFTGFEESKINSHEANGELYLFIFGVPGVSQSYYATIEKMPYQCTIDSKYPDVLICVGEYFSLSGEYVDVKFYQDELKNDLVYENFYFSGPTKPAYTIVYAPRDTWCENRGMNVNCETEYRQYHGETCVASTCYDDCGYYYSIDTCPYDSDEYNFVAKP